MSDRQARYMATQMDLMASSRAFKEHEAALEAICQKLQRWDDAGIPLTAIGQLLTDHEIRLLRMCALEVTKQLQMHKYMEVLEEKMKEEKHGFRVGGEDAP